MRWKNAAAAAVVALAGLSGLTACSDEPEARTAAGVPERWYTTVDDELAGQPGVSSVAMLDSGGRCPLRDEVVLAGEKVSDVSDHGVVRLGGEIPAVLCHWYEGTPVEVEVAHAPDAAGYAELVTGSRATRQPANEQTEQDVVVDGRTVHVVRTTFVTNPAAGFNLRAAVLDEGARGRVTLEVSGADEVAGYDERSVAADLIAFLAG